MKVYELKLTDSDEAGVTAISLVESPATEEYFIAFNKTPDLDKLVQFKSIDDEKRVVMGAAMIPNKQIYRRDGDDEFFVFFKEDTIRRIAEKFFLDGKINSATVEHIDTLNGVTVVESWIVTDSEKDKSAAYGFSYPVGTWVISMKINNPDIWDMIKNEQIRGFSVEGIFANQLIKNSNQMDFEKLSDSIVEKIKKVFQVEDPEKDPEKDPAKTKFGSIEATSSDGTVVLINFEGDALTEGMNIFLEVEGEQVPVPTGEYVLADSRTIVVAEDGVVGTITEVAEELETEVPDKDEILAAVAGLLDEFMDTFMTNLKAAQDKQVEGRLEEFRKDLKLPATDPIRKDPAPSKRSTFKSLNAKIRERNAPED